MGIHLNFSQKRSEILTEGRKKDHIGRKKGILRPKGVEIVG